MVARNKRYPTDKWGTTLVRSHFHHLLIAQQIMNISKGKFIDEIRTLMIQSLQKPHF
jgi:hypothetical protein